MQSRYGAAAVDVACVERRGESCASDADAAGLRAGAFADALAGVSGGVAIEEGLIGSPFSRAELVPA